MVSEMTNGDWIMSGMVGMVRIVIGCTGNEGIMKRTMRMRTMMIKTSSLKGET